MDRDDILVKSREENKKKDEYQLSQEKQAEFSLSTIVLLFFFIILILSSLGYITGELIIFNNKVNFNDVAGSLLTMVLLIDQVIRYHYLKRKRNLYGIIFWASLIVIEIIVTLVRL